MLQILQMKMTSNGRQPQMERWPQGVQTVTYELLEEIRGNLECGPAQPILFFHFNQTEIKQFNV